jgi:hypothetical protein
MVIQNYSTLNHFKLLLIIIVSLQTIFGFASIGYFTLGYYKLFHLGNLRLIFYVK